VRRVDLRSAASSTDRLMTDFTQRIMGGLIVGIDGGRGPVATGALTRLGAAPSPRRCLMTYSLLYRLISRQMNDFCPKSSPRRCEVFYTATIGM
jgi:hypothetical protein